MLVIALTPRLAILFDNLNLPESENERYFFMYGCPTRLFPKRQGCVPRTSVMNLFLGIDVSAQVIVLKNRTLPNSILNSRLFFSFRSSKINKNANPLPRGGCLKSFLRSIIPSSLREELRSFRRASASCARTWRNSTPIHRRSQPTRLTARLGIAPRAPWLGTVSSPSGA